MKKSNRYALCTFIFSVVILLALISQSTATLINEASPTHIGKYLFSGISGIANPLWWDEAVYMGLAENLYKEKSYSFNTDNQEKFRAPLYPTILATLFFITKESETAPIYLNTIIAILTAIAAYHLAQHLFCDRKTSMASAILIITSQQYIFWSSKILTEPLAILMTTASLLIFTLITKKNRTCLYPLLGFTLALSFLTRYTLILLPLYFIVYLMARDRSHLKINLRKISIASLVFTITIIPWMYNSYTTYNHPLGSALFNIDLVNDLYKPDPETYYISNFYTFLPFLGPLFTLGILISILKKRSSAREEYFLIGWFLMTLIILSAGIGQKHMRFLLIALPSIAIISAKTLSTLTEKTTQKHALSVMAIIVLLISISSASSGLTESVENKQHGIILREAAEYIKSSTEKNSTNNIMSENYPLFYYYTKQTTLSYPKDKNSIDEFIKRYNISYIVVDNFVHYPGYTGYYFDNNPAFKKEFEKNESTYFVKIYSYIGTDKQ